jgi:hypothetical protein
VAGTLDGTASAVGQAARRHMADRFSPDAVASVVLARLVNATKGRSRAQQGNSADDAAGPPVCPSTASESLLNP